MQIQTALATTDEAIREGLNPRFKPKLS